MAIFRNEKIEKSNAPIRKFFAIRKLPDIPNDYWPRYQIEIATIQAGHVLDVELYDKPDTLQMIMSKFQEFADPNNEGLKDEDPYSA